MSRQASVPGIRLSIESGLPFAGHNSIEIATEAPSDKTLALRVSGWSGKTALKFNGQSQSTEAEKGYVYLRRVWNNGDKIELDFEMPVCQKFCPF